MEIFTAQQLEDIKDEVRFVCIKDGNIKHVFNYFGNWSMTVLWLSDVSCAYRNISVESLSHPGHVSLFTC